MSPSLTSALPRIAEKFAPISVIVPHYRHKEALHTCLKCIQAQDYEGPVTVYVVDNSESYALHEMEKEYPDFVFVWQPEAGSYNARNYALAQVKDELVAFTDADCRPSSSWLRAGVARLLADPKAGIIGGRIIVTPDNPTSPSLSSFFEMAIAFRQDDYVNRMHFVATANMFTRMSVFGKVGLFDAKQKSSGDYLWGRRVKAQGYELLYDADAVIEHPARNYAQLHTKALRLVAGRRDINPGWKAGTIFILSTLLPPMNWFGAVMRYSHPKLSLGKKLFLFAYCIYYRWLTGYARLRLAVTNVPSPR